LPAKKYKGVSRVINALKIKINDVFIGQMIVPGSNYWNMGFGLNKGDVEKDEEGLGTMKVLGKNMAWLLKKIHG